MRKTAVLILSMLALSLPLSCKKSSSPTTPPPTGGNPATATPTGTLSLAPTVTPTPTGSSTLSPTWTLTPSSPTPGDTATGTATQTSSLTASPTDTSTPTPSETRTFSPTHTRTSTFTGWCPGVGGTVGNSSATNDAGFNPSNTFATRAYLGASVSITALRVYGSITGLTQQAGVYSDDGSGTAPANLLTSLAYTNDTNGWRTVDVPDIVVGPGYFWLAVSAASDDDFNCYACLSCGGDTMIFAGRMPSTASGPTDHPWDLAILAEWSCPSAAPTGTATPTPTSSATVTDTPAFVCTVTPGAAMQSETEYNNTTGTADDLGTLSPASLWVTGTLDEAVDSTDYFQFTAAETAYYRFYLDCRASSGFSLYFYIGSNVIGAASGGGLLTYDLLAQKGLTYVVRVYTTSGSGAYDLKLGTAPFAAQTAVCTATPGAYVVTEDAEFNQSQGTAQSLGAQAADGIWIRGGLDAVYDSNDYFTFMATATGPYVFELDCWNNGLADVRLHLSDTGTGFLGEATGGDVKTFTVNAVSGTQYWIRVFTGSGTAMYDLKCH